jgi:hypothetical protein
LHGLQVVRREWGLVHTLLCIQCTSFSLADFMRLFWEVSMSTYMCTWRCITQRSVGKHQRLEYTLNLCLMFHWSSSEFVSHLQSHTALWPLWLGCALESSCCARWRLDSRWTFRWTSSIHHAATFTYMVAISIVVCLPALSSYPWHALPYRKWGLHCGVFFRLDPAA